MSKLSQIEEKLKSEDLSVDERADLFFEYLDLLADPEESLVPELGKFLKSEFEKIFLGKKEEKKEDKEMTNSDRARQLYTTIKTRDFKKLKSLIKEYKKLIEEGKIAPIYFTFDQMTLGGEISESDFEKIIKLGLEDVVELHPLSRVEDCSIDDIFAVKKAVEQGKYKIIEYAFDFFLNPDIGIVYYEHGQMKASLCGDLMATAASVGNIEMLEYLKRKGASVSIEKSEADQRDGTWSDSTEEYPLIKAIESKSVAGVKWLLENGANVHAIEHKTSGQKEITLEEAPLATALFNFIFPSKLRNESEIRDNCEIIKELLNRSADLNKAFDSASKIYTHTRKEVEPILKERGLLETKKKRRKTR